MLTTEKMEALLREPQKPSRKEQLEGVVRERTPQYVILNNPQYDEELLRAHIELAEIYGEEGKRETAQEHLRTAESELFNMCRVRTNQPTYIRSDTDFKAVARREKEFDGKLSAYRSQMWDVAEKIGYDATSLVLAPISSNPNNTNLTELVGSFA
jgi:hypothetical protein